MYLKTHSDEPQCITLSTERASLKACECALEMTQSQTTSLIMAPQERDTDTLQPHDSKNAIRVKQPALAS